MAKSFLREKAQGGILEHHAETLGVSTRQLRRWVHQLPQLKASAKNKKESKTIHPGKVSQLEPIKTQLLHCIFEMREKGQAVSIRLVALKAGELLPEFRIKSKDAQRMAVERCAKTNNLAYRVPTHDWQQEISKTIENAEDFVSSIAKILAEPSYETEWLINMDQTPFFLHDTKKHP